jgi:hypothetical protein
MCGENINSRPRAKRDREVEDEGFPPSAIGTPRRLSMSEDEKHMLNNLGEGSPKAEIISIDDEKG